MEKNSYQRKLNHTSEIRKIIPAKIKFVSAKFRLYQRNSLVAWPLHISGIFKKNRLCCLFLGKHLLVRFGWFPVQIQPFPTVFKRFLSLIGIFRDFPGCFGHLSQASRLFLFFSRNIRFSRVLFNFYRAELSIFGEKHTIRPSSSWAYW